VSDRFFRVHPQVEEDLAEAVEYLLSEAPNQADRLIERTRNRLRFIAQFPLAGPAIYVKYRHVVVTPFKYMVVYRVTDTEVQVLRLTHAMRDPASIEAEVRRRDST
jgi:plasmid stabilization system protein ParE